MSFPKVNQERDRASYLLQILISRALEATNFALSWEIPGSDTRIAAVRNK